MEQVARLLRHVGDVAGPHRDRQQHDVHRGKAGDGEALQQPFGLGAVVRFDAFRRERMGLIADAFDRLDDAGGVDLIVAPIDGEPALGEVDPRVDDARQFGQAVLDLADAAGAADAFDGKRHVRGAGRAALNEHRQIECFGHLGCSPQDDAILGSELPLALARQFDDEVPLPGRYCGAAAKMAGCYPR